MRVKALKSIYYNRRMRAEGDVYDMDDREHSEAKILAAIGKIEILQNVPQATPVSSYETAALKVEDESTTAEPMNTEDSRIEPRRYRRRDMRAEK